MGILVKVKWAVAGICALALLASAAGCSKNTSTGAAYALTGGGDYVGMASVTLENGNISALSLEEVQFPSHITVGDGVSAEDKTEGADGKYYYNKVLYGTTTLVYDSSQGYMSGGIALVEYFSEEERAKEYILAVLDNKVAVEVGGVADYSVMTKAALSKADDDYWIRTNGDGKEYSRWKLNRDATVNYVLKYGVDNLDKLTKSEEAAQDSAEDMDVYYWLDGDIVTGATWTHLNPENPQGYVSYAQLILNAYAAAK